MPRKWSLAARYVKHRFASLHPFEVQAELTSRCNLRCAYCRCPDLRMDELETSAWVDAIEAFSRVGTARIKFQGGEPTIRTDFQDLCRAAQRCGVISAVVTNGIAIARRPELLDALDEIVVSLDAVTPEFHDRQRGPGTHALAVRAIDAARSRGRKVFVNMVVTTDTLAEVEAMLEFCERRAIGFNAQAAMFARDYQDPDAAWLALPKDVHSAFQSRLAEWARAGRPVMFSPRSYEHAAHWPDDSEPTTPSDGPSRCMAGRFYVHVAANGDVYPCNLQATAFRPKNLRRDGFEAALTHARHHECGDCMLPYLNERKALFALRPDAVRAWMRRS